MLDPMYTTQFETRASRLELSNQKMLGIIKALSNDLHLSIINGVFYAKKELSLMKGRKILKISTCIVLLMTVVAGNFGVEAQEVEITTSKIKQGPFKIGVIGYEQNSAVGKTIEEATREQRSLGKVEESIQILEEDIQEIPDEIDALWIAESNLKDTKVKK
ncbi:hypothetical protein ABE205_25000 [Brevibacillus agri]|nr:hypothetical protein [Brevibacillus sp. NSP2.1]ELK41901.1 hypothetical protein D478_11537 [Brevibacillus agri BAB-2500]QHZ58352.1 hypothetical protein M655_023400 [Brevibacillus sp. NSP2.1]